MGKFSLSLSSRKKQADLPAPTYTGTSKVHRLLGSGSIDLDAPKPGYDLPSSRIKVQRINEDEALDLADSDSDPELPDDIAAAMRSRRQWHGRSEKLPPPIDTTVVYTDEDDWQEGMPLRGKQSSSTIKSAHDSPALPYTISHQSSSPSMSRGLPSKAMNLLDMGNDHETAKQPKKKPARLDLSSLMPSRSHAPDRFARTLAHAKSPSKVSPPTHLQSPKSPRRTRRLQKRPTQENMWLEPAVDSSRPNTSGEPDTGLDSLYNHYEQMSLRQLMDLESHDEESPLPEIQSPYTANQDPRLSRSTFQTMESDDPMEPMFEMVSPQPPTTAQTEISKLEQLSVDCATSVSSRHTRTSKASKHTDPSMQGSDLQDKSVLLLSSDSEDDDTDEPDMGIPTAPVPRPRQQSRQPVSHDKEEDDSVGPMEHFRPGSAFSPWHAEPLSRTSSKASNRKSTLPGNMASPARPVIQSPPIDHRTNSSRAESYSTVMSPSRASVMSSSTACTVGSWQPSNGLPNRNAEAQAMQIPTARSGLGLRNANNLESDSDCSETDTSVYRDSVATTISRPMPPPNPHAVPAPQSQDQESRLITVTRQEEILLAALRQRRQALEEGRSGSRAEHQPQLPPIRRHKSDNSQVSVAESGFNFNFPTPPRTSMKPPTRPLPEPVSTVLQWPASAPLTGQFPRDSCVAGPIFAPAPTRPMPKKGILKNASFQDDVEEEPEEQQSVLTYLQRPMGPGYPLDEPEPSPDLSDFMDFDPITPDSGYMTAEVRSSAMPVPQSVPQQGPPPEQHRGSMYRITPQTTRRPSLRKQVSTRTAQIADRMDEIDESTPWSSRGSTPSGIANAGDTPRPDSPISADCFPAIPPSRMTLNKLARLSAVGPGRTSTEPGWWGDDD